MKEIAIIALIAFLLFMISKELLVIVTILVTLAVFSEKNGRKRRLL